MPDVELPRGAAPGLLLEREAELAALGAQGLLSPTCLVTLSASGAQTASACMKYDTADHQYIYNWKLGTNTGNEAITVAVSYPGTTSTTTLSEPVVITS